MRRLIVVFNLIEQIVSLFGELVAVAIIAVLRFVVPFDDAVASALRCWRSYPRKLRAYDGQRSKLRLPLRLRR